MNRLALPLAIVASLVIAGTALGAKPRLAFETATTSTAQGTVLGPTSVAIDTDDTNWILVLDSSASVERRLLRSMDFGFEID